MDKMILDNSMLNNFSYHDGRIIEFIKDGNDYTLKFIDGWIDGQENTILFKNAKVEYKFDLIGREIYQLGGIDYLSSNRGLGQDRFLFEIYVWYKDNLLEVVRIEADNIYTTCTNSEGIFNEDLLSLLKKRN